MQPTIEILKNLNQNSIKNKNEVFTRLFRYLLRADLYYVAYKKLYANSGAATKGIDDDTADGFSNNKVERIIQKLSDGSYRPKPVRRTYIAKANGKLRPLGIPTFTDKLVQEVLRMILEAVYEPVFSEFSHGFRPNKSCHTALKDLRHKFHGTKWFIEGDIKGCLTDIAKGKGDESRAADVIKNWLRARTTLEFLGTWELMYNPEFKVVEFDHFKNQAGLHTFTMSAKQWIESTNAKGLYVQAGKYGGTYAHKDIAFEFASAISPVFKLYLIKEFQRLEEKETSSEQVEWNIKRVLTKNNYLIHTDAVKNYILPKSSFSSQTEWIAYADEADLLNVALFQCTAKQWRDANPELAKKNRNIRDYATINELTVLSNLETHNAEMIKANVVKAERFKKLLEIAEYQIRVLNESDEVKRKPLLTNDTEKE